MARGDRRAAVQARGAARAAAAGGLTRAERRAAAGNMGGNKKKKKKGGKMSRFENKLAKETAIGEQKGQELIDKFLPDIDAIGGTVREERSDEIRDLLTRFNQGLGGLNAAENEALRAQASRALDRQLTSGLRSAASLAGRSGLRGGAATAQARDLALQRAMAQRNIETDILAQNIDVQDRRRNALANFLQSVEADELSRQQFNIGQQKALQAGQAGLFFGGQQLDLARRGALRDFILGKRGIKLAKQAELARQEAAAQATSGINDLLGNLFGGGGAAGGAGATTGPGGVVTYPDGTTFDPSTNITTRPDGSYVDGNTGIIYDAQGNEIGKQGSAQDNPR